MADPIITDTRRLAQRFWKRVAVIDDETQCWLWTGCRLRGNWHGQIRIGSAPGKLMYTHRLAFFLQHGWLPKVVQHTCDVPHCCNPEHLRAGSPAENNADMRAKGRDAKGNDFEHAKLTDEKVREIRRRYGPASEAITGMRIEGRPTMDELAIDYGVTVAIIHGVLHGRIWKHVPFEDVTRHAATPIRIMRGERAVTAKLTEDQVQEIRARYGPPGHNGRRGRPTFAQLGKEYGLDPTSVYAIVHRHSWAHVK